MLYFQTIPFPRDLKQPDIEKAFRKSAIKESLSLDFKRRVIDIGTDKLFLGLEGKTALKFTRIRTSFEFMLPKLIISLPKDQSATAYRIRFSAIPIAVIILLLVGLFAAILSLINGSNATEGLVSIFILSIVFFLLTALELKITKSSVLKALKLI